MKLQPQRKNTGGHAKIIIIVSIVIAALVLTFFNAGYKTALFPNGIFASSIPGKNTPADQGNVEAIGAALQLAYQLIYIEKAVGEKLNNINYVKLADVAPELKNAIIAIEDNRFYRHHGIDVEGIFRAVLVNLQSGTVVEGGSTITQQLAKNLFLSQERSWKRKFEEIIFAVRIEHNYSKDDILEMYLNTIYFGSGAYGVKKASAIYFNKPPNALNLAESALLAGLPNAPSINSPYVNLAAAKKRQGLVLDAMAKYKYIELGQAQGAKSVPLKLAQ